MGVELIPSNGKLNLPIGAMRLILTAEAAAAFDELTRSGRDSMLVRQTANAWPNIFRGSRFIPAVEYIQAMRLRQQLVQEIHSLMQEVDVLIVPSFAGNQLTTTNLTGHPVVVVPNGFMENGSPTSICFLGNLFDEAKILSVAKPFRRPVGMMTYILGVLRDAEGDAICHRTLYAIAGYVNFKSCWEAAKGKYDLLLKIYYIYETGGVCAICNN